jgi:hypothetical protein
MIQFNQSKKLERVLFFTGVAAGALLGARGPILKTSEDIYLGVKSQWTQQRVPASGTEAVDDCSQEFESEGMVSWQRLRFRSGNCSLMIRSNRDGIPNRSISLGSNGAMMIFSQFGPSLSRDSGAQLYFFFPRTQSVPRARVISDSNEVAVSTASGSEIRFSMETGMISRTSADLALDQSSDITEANRGGITVNQWSGILLDLGFTRREQPFFNRPNGIATFRDSQGGQCRVRNSDIFDYSSPDEPRFRLVSDADTLSFLQERCARLDLSSLQRQGNQTERAALVEAARSEVQTQSAE